MLQTLQSGITNSGCTATNESLPLHSMQMSMTGPLWSEVTVTTNTGHTFRLPEGREGRKVPHVMTTSVWGIDTATDISQIDVGFLSEEKQGSELSDVALFSLVEVGMSGAELTDSSFNHDTELLQHNYGLMMMMAMMMLMSKTKWWTIQRGSLA